ncbi:low affinity iron permease family protein [Spirosoma soli]|uniref:Low affinity iron permease family protein n=1 Tax=Spirosoma soli TaxID=1770529 RepID=A0ABW5M7V9_9BACT
MIAVNRKASNRLLNVEDLTEAELHALHQFFGRLAEKAKLEDSLSESHSIEDAEKIHQEKLEEREKRHQAKKNKQPATD